MSYAVEQLKAWSADVEAVAEALGLERARERHKWSCPWCNSHDALSLTAPEEQLRAKCFSCDGGGDVFNLVAAAQGLDVRTDFREVLQVVAELAGRLDLLEEETKVELRPRPVRKAPPPPEYPPVDEVMELWDAAERLSRDSAEGRYLAGRGFFLPTLERLDVLRVLNSDCPRYEWASTGTRGWREVGYRMVVPVYDAGGYMRALRGWCLQPPWPGAAKRVAVKGHSSKGLVMANAAGVAMLRGSVCGHVVLVEGEPDWLAATSHVPDGVAVLGVTSGCWTEHLAARVPDNATVAIWTHNDAAGDKYADEIRRTLAGRCRLYRAKPTEPHEERKAS